MHLFDDAQQMLSSTAEKLRASGLANEADALELELPSMAPMSYDPAARKRMHYDSHRRRRGKQI